MVRAFHRASDLLVSCGVNFSLLPDSALDRLPATAKTLIYPVPLDPPDDVVDQLRAFVEKGGALYISGDISYDAQCQPTKRERLTQLCGVEAAGQPTAAPLTIPPAEGPAMPSQDSGITAWVAHPFLPIKLAGAETLVACNGLPVVTCFKRGKGQVWFSAEPLELSLDMKTQASNHDLYRAFLRAAGTPALAVTPATPELHAFHVPGEDADAWVFHNNGPATEVAAGAFIIELATNGAGFLLVGPDNAVRVIEAQGSVRRQGIELAHISGHAFIVAADNRTIEHSGDLLVLPLTAGEIVLTSSLPANTTAEVGELRDGHWRCLTKLTCNISAGKLHIAIPQEFSREMIRVTVPPTSSKRHFWFPFIKW